jgi:hypothetical protein
MHSVCYVAVEAEDEAGAIEAAELFLVDISGRCVDYYVIGGRWSKTLAGADTVCAGDRRRVFLEAVQQARLWAQEAYHDVRQHIVGPDPRVVIRDTVSGDGERPELYDAMVERIWDGYRSTADELNELFHGAAAPDPGHRMALWHLRRFADMLGGAFSTDSYIYDTVAETTGVRELLERVDAEPHKQWLVVADLHH